MKKFNTTGICVPTKHYMVDISQRLAIMKKMIEGGNYFCINRPRQYGKTTTLAALKHYLNDDYVVLSLDFQGISQAGFKNESTFVSAFARKVVDLSDYTDLSLPTDVRDLFLALINGRDSNLELDDLFRAFRVWMSETALPMILIIDEVDSASNNQVFLDFLSFLRDGYIARDAFGMKAFQSVILAGVTDIKHIRSKIRDEDQHRVNSPWNIAVDFTVDMSLSENGIKGMLDEYAKDHGLDFDTAAIAKSIRDYTSGYPFLVSRICQIIDEDIIPGGVMGEREAWGEQGVVEAVKRLLIEENTLFQSFYGKLTNYPELKGFLRDILMRGDDFPFNAGNEQVAQLQMYGFIKNDNGRIKVANRIFETLLYNLFISEDRLSENPFYGEGSLGKNRFVKNGALDVRLILEGFVQTFHDIYGSLQERFKEKDGRELFLLYLKPIINGTGNYYIEAETRDRTRTDIIIDYLGKQHVIELKIWRGERYNQEGEEQIVRYLDYYHLNVGYMLSFNFGKEKKVGVKLVHVSDKILFEAMV